MSAEPLNYRERVYAVVRHIPRGKVASYGQVARLAAPCTARMVGFALAGLPKDNDVPWQRVINRMGKISPHGAGFGSAMQRALLEEEGVRFGPDGRVDWDAFSWDFEQ